MNLVQKFITKNPSYTANVNKADSRYTLFQKRGPLGLMLHSVGCAQPNALVFVSKWDNVNYDIASCHAVIDANNGTIYQTMPWNFRAWHCGGSANNTHVGVEMCESKYIRYTSGAKFDILDKAKAQADCRRAYKSAVELFAMLCNEYNLNPMKDIVSHREGGKAGIASGHVDPEHYWNGLGMNYTMAGFREDVKKEMEGNINMTVEELNSVLDNKFAKISAALSKQYSTELNSVLLSISKMIDAKLDERLGKYITHVDEIPWTGVRNTIQKLLDEEAINGGTPKEEDATDINMNLEDVRVMAVITAYINMKINALKEEFLSENN